MSSTLTAAAVAPSTPSTDLNGKCGRRALQSISVNAPPRSSMKKPVPEKPVAESRTALLEKEQAQAQSEPAFRGIPSLTSEDFDDLLSLKRANPVYESDDEEDFRFAKRQRRDERDDEEEFGVPQEVVLYWSDRVVEDEEHGYLLSLTRGKVE